ncbi:hypothetical protein UC34_04700 [Pandoraea vervacti]|uniref:Uncharacterized protein n=1 Tax=Pandoraea vervacti TaxID=656178 RepID=A0ABM5SVH0_9BURK|nr:hypothetical protein [Pandoraea vervacti]AJP56489.1 hypothetical protein UC34_04700 [Pandoraea vervacti]
MRLPFALAAIDWIAPRDVLGTRTLLDLDGQDGWTCPVAGGYCVATPVALPAWGSTSTQPLPAALCVDAECANAQSGTTATSAERGLSDATPSRWLMRIALALAGQPELRNDSLCIAHETLWWTHRFDDDTPTAQVEAQLRRQMLACEMLSSQGLRTCGTRAASYPASPAAHGARVSPDDAGRTGSTASAAAGAARRFPSLWRG